MNKTKQNSKRIFLFGKTQEFGKIIGQKGTLKILTLIDEKGRQYKELEKQVNINHTLLIRRLNALQNLNIIKKKPVRSKRRETHEYVLTPFGEMFMKFAMAFEKDISTEATQKIIVDFTK